MKSTGNVINCGKVCQHAFPLQSYVLLTPTGLGGDRFDGWKSGCDSVHGITCVVLMNRSRTVIASFLAKGQSRANGEAGAKKLVTPGVGVRSDKLPKPD